MTLWKRWRSPLAGVRYERGALPAANERVNQEVRQFLAEFERSDQTRRTRLRDRLTEQDNGTLLRFADEAVRQALNEELPKVAAEATIAIAAIESERFDWRDTLTTLGLITYTLRRLTPDPDAVLNRAREVAGPIGRSLIDRFVEASDDDASLRTWGYRHIQTVGGSEFIRDGGKAYHPTVDLLGMARQVAALLENDTYSVIELETGAQLPAIWLRQPDADEARTVIERCRAGVALDTWVAGCPPDAIPIDLFVWLIEARDDEDARHLAEWMLRPGDPTCSVLAVHNGPLLCVLISNQLEVGEPPYESLEAIGRFKEPLDEILARSRE